MIEIAFILQIVGAIILFIGSLSEIKQQFDTRKSSENDDETGTLCGDVGFYMGNDNAAVIISLIKREIAIFCILLGYLIMAYLELKKVIPCILILLGVIFLVVAITKCICPSIEKYINKKYPIEQKSHE